MGKFQRVQHIAAHEDVGIDAVAFELAGEPDMVCTSGFQRLGGLDGFVLIARIGAADAGNLAAGGLERGGRFRRGLRRHRRLRRLKATSGEEVAREIRARIVLGNRAERGKEDGRPLGRSARCIAQGFILFGKTDARQSVCGGVGLVGGQVHFHEMGEAFSGNAILWRDRWHVGYGRGDLVEQRELADARDRHLAFRNVLGACLAHICDTFLKRAGNQRLGIAAFGFYGLELFPRRFGEVVGEGLCEPGAAGRVGHAAKLAFFHGDDLGVARDAPAQLFRNAERLVEGADGKDVCAADGSCKGCRRIAQHVGPRIIARQHATR